MKIKTSKSEIYQLVRNAIMKEEVGEEGAAKEEKELLHRAALDVALKLRREIEKVAMGLRMEEAEVLNAVIAQVKLQSKG
jgi:hypothetical protein